MAEIGVEDSGQLLVLDQIFKMDMYSMFDLPPVLKLVSTYLGPMSQFGVQAQLWSDGSEVYDLVISNYAFSIPSRVQMKYIEKIISEARRISHDEQWNQKQASPRIHLSISNFAPPCRSSKCWKRSR